MHAGSRISDVIVMEIELKAPMEPYKILLEPYAVVIPGGVFIHTTLRRQFKVEEALFSHVFALIFIFHHSDSFSRRFCLFCQMWNHSRTFINFQWEENNSDWHTIEVEPSSGRIGLLHDRHKNKRLPDFLTLQLYKNVVLWM